MLKKYFIFLGVLIGLAVPISVGAEEKVLYCVDEQGVGFAKTDGEYKLTRFKLERFTAKLNGYASLTLVDTESNRTREFECSGKGLVGGAPVVCRSENKHDANSITIDVVTYRYSRSVLSYGGFVTNGTDTESIHLGRCTTF